MVTENTSSVPLAEQALLKEPVSPPAETGQKIVTPPAEPPALTEERVQQLIVQATAKAVAEAKEVGKRELQSQQDRNRAELARTDRQRKLAEGRLDAAQVHLRNVDPEAAKEFELATLRAEREGRVSVEQEEQSAQIQAEVVQKFHAQMNQFVTNLGVDAKDERIDWGGDAADLLERQQRILDSVAKIQKGNIQAMQTAQGSLEKRLKEVEAKIKVAETEANSVTTSTSLGVVAGSDAEFVKKFANDEVPLTKANRERYEKILNS